MSETEFRSIPPDAVIDFVRMHPEIFLVYQPLSDHDLCAKLLVKRETPRLCRGGSSSLTIPGVSQ